MGNDFAVRHNGQARTLVVTLPLGVPQDGKVVAVVFDAVQAKPVPGVVGEEGMDFDGVIGAGSKTHQTSDEQIGKRRMIVVEAALGFEPQPLAIGVVEVFADEGFAVAMLTADVGEESVEIVVGRDDGLGVVAQEVAEGPQCLRGGEGPDRSVPFTFAAAVGTKPRVPAFGGGDAARGLEPFGVEKLCPGGFAAGGGEIEAPGDETDFFASAGEPAIRTQDFVELCVRVPE